MSLNPIFKEHVSTSNPNLNTNAKPVPRKPRSDKTHDIRFPVTAELKTLIRRLAKANKMKETQYTTKMLLAALSSCQILPEYDYHDTKIYMHVKPTELHYEKVFDLAVKHGISERKTVTQLIIYILNQRGGRL